MNASFDTEFHWQGQVDQQSASVIKLGTGLFITTLLACTVWASFTPISKNDAVSAKAQVSPIDDHDRTLPSTPNSNQLQSTAKYSLRTWLGNIEHNNQTPQFDRRTTASVANDTAVNGTNQMLVLRGTENWSVHQNTIDQQILVSDLQSELTANLKRRERLSVSLKAKKDRFENLQQRFKKLERLAKDGYIAKNHIKEHSWELLEVGRNISTFEKDTQLLSEEIDRIRALVAKIQSQKIAESRPSSPSELRILPAQFKPVLPPSTSSQDNYPTSSVPEQSPTHQIVPTTNRIVDLEPIEKTSDAASVVVNVLVAKNDLKLIQFNEIARVDFQSDKGQGIESYLGQIVSNHTGLESDVTNPSGPTPVKIRILDSEQNKNQDMPVSLSRRLAGKTGTVRFAINEETYLTRFMNPFLEYLKREKWIL